jgi:hypothetical protein
MKSNFIKISISFFLSVLIFSCKNEDSRDKLKEEQTLPSEDKSFNNYNISILLDLSDRISPKKSPNKAMEFYERDLSYINSISEVFTTHIKSKKIRQMNDKIEIYFNPEPQDQEINNISKKLKFEFNKDNSSKDNINLVNTTYKNETAKIYDLAIKDDNYVGSDIWKFFANNVTDYCIDNKHRNILIILTDGYLFHNDTRMIDGNLTTYLLPETVRSNGLNKANWNDILKQKNYGFIPANDDLSNLEVLVLGINPNLKNPYEGKVINEYWSNWFTSMKVKKFVIKETGLPSNMDKVIKDFIQN